MLYISTFCHGHNTHVIPDVKHTILLEHWTEHVLHDHRWARVADEAGLLIELLGEKVDTQVAVLTGLGRGGDADDLAWTALKQDYVTNANEVAGYSDGALLAATAAVVIAVGCPVAATSVRHVLTSSTSGVDSYTVLDVDICFFHAVLVVMVATLSVDWMQDTIGGAMNTLTERMILSLVVVISHITLVLAIRSVVCTLSDFHLFVDDLTVASCSSEFTWGGAFVLPAAELAVLLAEWNGAVSVVSLGDVDVGVKVHLGCWSVTGVVLAVLHVDLGVNVPLVRFTVAGKRPLVLVAMYDGSSDEPG